MVNNKAQFDAAVSNTAIKTIKLGDNVTGDLTINRLANLDLNNKTVTGNVVINTTQAGTLNISAGTITGNLTINAENASIVNNATVSGTTTINNVAQNTFTNKGTLANVVINDADGTRFVNEGTTGVIDIDTTGAVTLEGNIANEVKLTQAATVTVTTGSVIAKVTVTNTATGAKVTNNGTVSTVDAKAPVELENNGTVADVAGDSEVSLSGTGTVDKVTNDKPVVNETKQDTSVSRDGDLVKGEDGVYKTSFKWASTNGIGTKEVKEAASPGGYNYYTDGAFLRFTVKQGQIQKKFNEVFKTYDDGNNATGGMTLQTNDGNVSDMDGSTRERTDWGVEGINNPTNLPGMNAVFYGVIQHADYGTKTVGFNAGESREIKMTLEPLADLAAGTYTIEVEAVQQGEGKVFGSISYDIVVEEAPDTQVPTATLEGFNSNSLKLSFDEAVKFDGTALESVDTTDKVSFIKSLFVANERYDLLDLAMDPNNIEITTTNKSVTLTLKNNALKQDIMHYLDDPSYTPAGFPELSTGDKNGVYRMDAEIDLSKFTDLADNAATGTISNPFKIQYDVTVNEGTPDYTSDVVAKFLTE